MRWQKNRVARAKVKVILKVKMQKNGLKQAVHTISLSLADGIANILAQMFNIMRWHVIHSNSLTRSKFKVIL
jgi:hypothetical protein